MNFNLLLTVYKNAGWNTSSSCCKLWFERCSVSRVRFCAHDLGLPALPAVDGYRSLGRICFSQEPADSHALRVDIRTAGFSVAPCVDRKFDWTYSSSNSYPCAVHDF